MKIAHVKISNILGLTELEFTPSGFNEISGPNGSGKTSVLEAIKAALNTGHDATLLRKGADSGEVVLVIDNGTNIRRRVTSDASPTEVRGVDGKKVARPAEVIRSFADLISVNPVDFLRAPKKDRVRVLLETMPIEVDFVKLSEIAGVPAKQISGIPALSILDGVHKQVYDDRTGTNRAIREKQGTIKQLKEAVPPVPPGADGDENALGEHLSEIDVTKDVELRRISTKLDDFRASRDTKLDELRKNFEIECEKVKAEFVDAERRAGIQREKAITKSSEARAPINEQLAIIRNNREVGARRAQTLETIGNLEIELDDLNAEADNQTAALASIEKYKSELLDALPIPGLEVKDGEIFRNGVQFDRLNTAQQVDIAVEIAKLRAGGLGVICVDGIELLDSGAFDAFRDRAINSGLQLFVSKVTDDEFSITTDA